MKKLATLLLLLTAFQARAAEPTVVTMNPERLVKVVGEINDSPAIFNVGNQILELSQKDKKVPIDVFIQSPGGSVAVYEHIALGMDMAREAGTPINCHVGERAYSAGAMMLLHCSHVDILKRGQVMYHSPAIGYMGQLNLDILTRMYTEIRSLCDTMLSQFRAAIPSKLPAKEFEDKFWSNLRAQRFFTADEFNAEYATDFLHPVDRIDGIKANELMERREEEAGSLFGF